MASQCAEKLTGVKAKPSVAGFAADRLKGEGVRNAVVSDEKRAAGQVFARALNRAGLTPKEAADLLGYPESSAVSRLTSGVDVPQIVAHWLVSISRLRSGLIEALAELPGDDWNVKTVIEKGRKVAVR